VILHDTSGPINSDATGYAGYHKITRNNNRYCFCKVFGQNLTIDDRRNIYAHTLSHEIAEMVVDPLANGVNPEVCDGCSGNCSNVWNDFFDSNGNYLDGSQVVPPGFTYNFFINWIIRPEYYDSANPNGCATARSNPHDVCVYPPPDIQKLLQQECNDLREDMDLTITEIQLLEELAREREDVNRILRIQREIREQRQTLSLLRARA
jgi:hypothetical protein